MDEEQDLSYSDEAEASYPDEQATYVKAKGEGMKVKFYYLALATALMTLGPSSLCLAGNDGKFSGKLTQFDPSKIDPEIFRRPIPPVSPDQPTIQGGLKFTKGKYGSVPDCKDAQLRLISEEYTEKPALQTKPGEINLGSGPLRIPIFAYKGKVSPDPSKGNSDSETTYCKYSVSVEKKFVGKKAYVLFDPNNNICGKTPAADSDPTVVVPTLSVKKDFQVTICGIG